MGAPPFPGCQLADTYSQGRFPVVPVVAEPKMDGYRLCVVLGSGRKPEFEFYCRGPEPVPWGRNLAYVGRQLAAAGFRDCMVDGEVAASTWGKTGLVRQGLSSRGGVTTYTPPAAEAAAEIERAVKFHVFDLVPLDRLERFVSVKSTLTRCSLPMSLRRRLLSDRVLAGGALCLSVKLVPQWDVRDEADLLAMRDRVVAQRGEGLMLKDQTAPYVCDRGWGWWKVVPVRTFNLVCVGTTEGEGKHRGKLGSLQGVTTDGRNLVVSAGTGFTDAEREAVWRDRDDVVGRVFEVEARVSDVATARHPAFKRWRVEEEAR